MNNVIIANINDLIDAHALSAEASTDLRDALGALDPQFAAFMLELTAGADLNRREVGHRGAAAILQFASVQVADDIADDELHYLPQQSGPGVQALLHTLACIAACKTNVSRADLALYWSDLALTGSAHQREVRVTEWRFSNAVEAATGLNGTQYRAYFRLMLSDTKLATHAASAGERFGQCLHVVGDRLSNDKRWVSLRRDDQQALLTWAHSKHQELAKIKIPGIQRHLSWFQAVLETPLRSTRS